MFILLFFYAEGLKLKNIIVLQILARRPEVRAMSSCGGIVDNVPRMTEVAAVICYPSSLFCIHQVVPLFIPAIWVEAVFLETAGTGHSLLYVVARLLVQAARRSQGWTFFSIHNLYHSFELLFLSKVRKRQFQMLVLFHNSNYCKNITYYYITFFSFYT